MIEKYQQVVSDSFTGYFNYLVGEILNLSWKNYFWRFGAVLIAV